MPRYTNVTTKLALGLAVTGQPVATKKMNSLVIDLVVVVVLKLKDMSHSLIVLVTTFSWQLC